MKRFRHGFNAVFTGAVLLWLGVVFAYDLTQEEIVYAMPMAHLDTQWQNTLDVTVSQLLPNTLHMNFNYFRQYPGVQIQF